MNNNENEIEPLKWAIKYNPAKIALEYNLKSINQTFLLDIDLEEKLKSIQSTKMICDLLYKTYPDILNRSYIGENQLSNLINKISAGRKLSPSNINANYYNSQEKFPSEARYYSKSNQNFFSNSNNNNINFVDHTEEDIKAELNMINKSKKAYDEEKSDIIRENSSNSASDKVNFRYKNYEDDYLNDDKGKVNRANNYIS